MLLSAVSVLVVAQSSSEFPEELMNNPVCQVALCSYSSFLTDPEGALLSNLMISGSVCED